MISRRHAQSLQSVLGLLPVVLLIGLLFGSRAQAAATANCTVMASPVAFGVYNPLSTVGTASTGTLKIVCTASGSGTITVTVEATFSTGLSGNYATRTMLSGSNTLNYNIYWDTAHTQIMGNGTGGSYSGYAGPITIIAGNFAQVNGTMYGYIPPLQDAVPGAYTDVLTLTITY